jgi:hypothetical protein
MRSHETKNRTKRGEYDAPKGEPGSVVLTSGNAGETHDVALAYVYAMEQEMATGTIITADGGAVLV